MIWILLLISIVFYYTIAKRIQNWILIAISIAVYWQYVQWYSLIIGAIACVVAYLQGKIARYHSKSILIALITILILIFIFLHSKIQGIIYPIGYSVFAFSAISLSVDQYRCPKRYSLDKVLSYLLFFPKLLAGPIERVGSYIQNERKKISATEFYNAFKILVFAGFCKYFISDRICATDMNGEGLNLAFKSISFALQFYFDFWAYSLMAISIGLLFGYKLSYNFDNPYYADGFKDFWHKWNITLGTWLRDYIYIPLGGNEVSFSRHWFNILITFIISALWHGLTLPFILWGLIHAVFVYFESHVNIKMFSKPLSICYRILVIIIIAFLWQTFRYQSIDELYRFVLSIFSSEHLSTTVLIHTLIAIVFLVILSTERLQHLIFYNQESKRAIIAEVVFISLMSMVMLAYNCNINSNFFYLNY